MVNRRSIVFLVVNMDIVAGVAESKSNYLSGYFRDGIRRIDIVLVSKECEDKAIERIKMNFISNCLDIGLQIEVEAGMGAYTADLLFIKFHAPINLIKHFGFYYNIRKFFKKSHLEFIFSYVRYEKEIIKTMRRLYPGPVDYSNYERSVIVHKILLSVPFGAPANFVGVNQLVESSIFLDIYPLHDGPFNFVPGQNPLHLNGRQALFYMWCNRLNIFSLTPVHLIREYLGERIGFFFAFYQFYNFALFILSIFAVYIFYTNYDITGREIKLNEHGMENTYDYASNTTEIKYKDFPVCPKCKDFVGCPFRYMKDYERELKMKLFLDNPYNFIFVWILSAWGTIFYLFWKRYENYLYWMWETTESDAKNLARPSFRNFPRTSLHLRITGPSKVREKGDKLLAPSSKVMSSPEEDYNSFNREVPCKKLLQFIVMMLILCLIFFGYFPLMIKFSETLLNRLRYFEEHMKIKQAVEQFNHFVVIICGIINGLCIVIMENAWWYIWKYMVYIDNPRCEWIYEGRHFYNLFYVSLVINFVMVFFYGLIKGSLYTVPNDSVRWRMPLGLGMLNCGILTCTDELFIFLISTFKTKYCFQEFLTFFQKTHLKTDAQENNDNIPVYEREFALRGITENTITVLYLKLFLQFAMVTFFVTNFQLGPIIAFVYNIWEIKYWAKVFVMHSRRPLLVQTWGLGGWTRIAFMLPYLAAVINVLYLSIHNTLLHRRFNKRYWSHQVKRRFLADYYMSFFNLSDVVLPAAIREDFNEYTKAFNSNVPHFCMWSGQYNRFITFLGSKRILHINIYVPMPGHFYILWHQGMLVLFYTVIMLCTGILLHSLIARRSKFVAETLHAEGCVRNYDITYAMASLPRYQSTQT